MFDSCSTYVQHLLHSQLLFDFCSTLVGLVSDFAFNQIPIFNNLNSCRTSARHRQLLSNICLVPPTLVQQLFNILDSCRASVQQPHLVPDTRSTYPTLARHDTQLVSDMCSTTSTRARQVFNIPKTCPTRVVFYISNSCSTGVQHLQVRHPLNTIDSCLTDVRHVSDECSAPSNSCPAIVRHYQLLPNIYLISLTVDHYLDRCPTPLTRAGQVFNISNSCLTSVRLVSNKCSTGLLSDTRSQEQ